MSETGTLVRRLRFQAQVNNSSPLYGHLLTNAAVDVEEGGPVLDVLRGHEDDPGSSALALRLMGAVHRLVLEGGAPELAQHYPAAGGTRGLDGAWPAFRATVADNVDVLRALVDRPVQTNEVGRCSVLVCGFLTVARETGLPLRVLEVGASSGLLLRWDHYRYRAGDAVWGDPSSPLDLGDPYEGTKPPFDVDTSVVERRGCDPSPMDPTSHEGGLALRSYLWPDQLDRFARLDAAIEVARRVPVDIDVASGDDWVSDQMAKPRPGVATVVYHSVMQQYMRPEVRERFYAAIEEAGAAATRDAPVAWLRFEPERDGPFPSRLRLWPGGTDRQLTEGGPHGSPVHFIPRCFSAC